MDNTKLKAYLDTTYTTFNPALEIRIGQNNEDLKALLKETNETTWVFITAENPKSKEISKEENKNLNQALETELMNKNFNYFRGAGIPNNPNWTPENSFLVLGMDQKTGIQLAIKYQQNAFVYGELEAPAELIYGYL